MRRLVIPAIAALAVGCAPPAAADQSEDLAQRYGISVCRSLGRNIMMAELRKSGVLQKNNLPYQRYEHHFKVTPQTFINRKTGETVPTATTSVWPSGIEFIRKRLAQTSELMEVTA